MPLSRRFDWLAPPVPSGGAGRSLRDRMHDRPQMPTAVDGGLKMGSDSYCVEPRSQRVDLVPGLDFSGERLAKGLLNLTRACWLPMICPLGVDQLQPALFQSAPRILATAGASKSDRMRAASACIFASTIWRNTVCNCSSRSASTKRMSLTNWRSRCRGALARASVSLMQTNQRAVCAL